MFWSITVFIIPHTPYTCLPEWQMHFFNATCNFCQVQLFKDDETLSDTGQNRTSVDVKFTPLDWCLALYSWQRRGFPAELHQLCVNNQGLTCGVKPHNWSDTSKRRLPPSLGGKTLRGAGKADGGWGGGGPHTCIDTDRLSHTTKHTHGAGEGGNGVPRLDDTVGVPILSYKCFLCLCQIASQPQMSEWNEHVMPSLFLVTGTCSIECVQPKSCNELKVLEIEKTFKGAVLAVCFH